MSNSERPDILFLISKLWIFGTLFFGKKNVLRKYDYICGLNIFRDGEKINWYAFTFT